MKIIRNLIFFLMLSISLRAEELDLSSSLYLGYDIEIISKGESLNELIQQLHKSEYDFYSYEEFRKEFLDWNRHLKNTSDRLLKDEYIYHSNPFSPNLKFQLSANLLAYNSVGEDLHIKMYPPGLVNKNKEEKREVASAGGATEAKNYNYFIHTTASLGIYQEIVKGSDISSEQNSPMTLGGGLVYFPNSMEKFSFSGSAYISYIVASEIDGPTGKLQTTDAHLNPEYGFTAYMQRAIGKTLSNVYLGLDYENFNIFNLEDSISGAQDLKVLDQSTTYFTAGVSLSGFLVRPYLVKLSASSTLTANNNMSGFKYMAYFNQKITKNTWYHLIYKQHELSKTNRDLSISRFGVGIGYSY